MIKIDILESPDFDALGPRTYSMNEIFIGGKKGNVIVNDDKIIDYHFKIEVNETKVMGSLHPNLKNFLLNGKLSQGKVSLKFGDKITLGSSVIQINEANFVKIPTYKETTNANLESLIAKNDPVLEFLKKLEKAPNEH